VNRRNDREVLVTDVLALTRELVAIDSQNPGPQERAIAAHVAEWARARGFGVAVLESVPGRPNLAVTLDEGGRGHLALSGHLDTKPVGDAASAWDTPPLELTVRDGRAYGLGATDMKGGVAAMLLALEDLAADPAASPRGRTTVLLTADEEQGSGAGAKALSAGGRLPEPVADVDAVVIGEPGGIVDPWEGIYLVSRGICCFDVEIRTRQGHSGLSPLLGRNAIQVAADVVHALEGFTPTVDRPGQVACDPLVNPGIFIEGGVSFGTWPGLCTVSAEIRLVPGMDRARLDRRIQGVVADAVAGHAEWQVRYRSNAQGWMPAVELAPSSPIVGVARSAVREVLGRDLPLAAFPGGTDATYLMGDAGVPTIASLGPGWISAAHGANESVLVSQLDEARRIYRAIARRYHDETTSEEPS
jgi:acetylornithine deacetylase/succinyl-diaminopimelate desuccinylase-like protein